MRYLSLSLLALLFIPFFAPAFGADWYDSNWLKARSITIDGADIDTADLTNYPLYVNITSLNVGTDTQADCDDIVFTNYQNTTKFSHEIENCDSTADWIEAWVRVPTVYNANNTQFFMYYDNAGATDQQATQATWNSNYKAVWHLNGTNIDSTTSPITCSLSGASATPDQYIGDSKSFDGIDDYLQCGSDAKIDNIFDGGGTISYWFYSVTDGENAVHFAKYGGNGGWASFQSLSATYGSRLSFYIDGLANDVIWESTNSVVKFGNWVYVVQNYNDDASTNDPVMYINGTVVTSSQTFGANVAYASDASNTLCLGNSNGSPCLTTRTVDGNMDEVRFYDTMASAEWIKADWECQRGAVDGNSCITVGNEGEEPVAGATRTNSDTQAHEDSIERQMQYNRANSDTLAHSESVVASVVSALVKEPADILAHEESVVAFVNDLNQEISDTMAQAESISAICTGTCGVAPTLNTIVLRVAPPTDIRLGGIFSGVCDFANNYTMIGIWSNGTIRCMLLP